MSKRLAFLAPLVALSGCAAYYSAPVVPPNGWIYSGISAPIDTDANNTSPGSKKGTAMTNSICGLIAWGDCSAATAARWLSFLAARPRLSRSGKVASCPSPPATCSRASR